MPADEVPGFLERLTEALTKRGLVAKPIDEQSLGDLAATIDPPSEQPAADAKKDEAAGNIEAMLRQAGVLPEQPAEALATLEDIEPPTKVEGAAVAVATSGEDPGVMADQVASPGGSTRAGLNVLDAGDALERLLVETLAASVRRDAEMAAQARGAGERPPG